MRQSMLVCLLALPLVVVFSSSLLGGIKQRPYSLQFDLGGI